MKTGTNTKKSGIARIIIYSTKNKYTAVCLDLDIIEEADSYKEVKDQIMEAVEGYITNVCKNNLDNTLLNRPADKKYV